MDLKDLWTVARTKGGDEDIIHTPVMLSRLWMTIKPTGSRIVISGVGFNIIFIKCGKKNMFLASDHAPLLSHCHIIISCKWPLDIVHIFNSQVTKANLKCFVITRVPFSQFLLRRLAVSENSTGWTTNYEVSGINKQIDIWYLSLGVVNRSWNHFCLHRQPCHMMVLTFELAPPNMPYCNLLNVPPIKYLRK